MKKVLFLLMAALLIGAGSVGAKTTKKGKKNARKAKTTVVAKGNFTGTYTNTGNGETPDYISISFDEATGTATASYKNGMGDIQELKGVKKGNAVEFSDAKTGELFGTAKFWNANTLKFDSVTGTFNRTSNEYKPFEATEKAPEEKAGGLTMEEAAEKVRKAAAAAAPVPTR